jgi:enamine deaminase RidA (YjgF/YER057c/UK114 family)
MLYPTELQLHRRASIPASPGTGKTRRRPPRAAKTNGATMIAMGLTQKLKELGITLPAAPAALGAYIPAKRVGPLVYVAGQLPMKDGKSMAAGSVPLWCSIDDARAAARQCVINALAAASSVVPLEQVVGVLRVGAFVLSDTNFSQQPQVANGASEFLVELFGDAGRHVRAAVGVNALPLDASVEIEFTFIVGEPGAGEGSKD